MDISNHMKKSPKIKRKKSDHDEDLENPLEFETKLSFKDDSYLIGSHQYFSIEDYYEQKIVENEIVHLIKGEDYEPIHVPSLVYQKSRSQR